MALFLFGQSVSRTRRSNLHRSLRSKAQIHSVLRDIPGVGEQTEKRLLLHFGSVARIASAPEQELTALVGPVLGARILEALKQGV